MSAWVIASVGNQPKVSCELIWPATWKEKCSYQRRETDPVCEDEMFAIATEKDLKNRRNANALGKCLPVAVIDTLTKAT